MNESSCSAVHHAALQLLSEPGVRFEHPQVFERLLQAGGKPGKTAGAISFPVDMVEEFLQLAPREVRLGAVGQPPRVLDSTSRPAFWTNPGLHILDGSEGSSVRDVTARDLALIARLSDRLRNIDGVMGMAMADIPPLHRDFVGVRLIAESCRKHVRALCFSGQGMEALVEMKEVLPGDWLSVGFTAHGPLRWTHLALDVFLRSAGHRIPTTINGEPMAGVTGPVTLAGSVALGNAEILAGIVANQVLEPGRPVIYNLGLAHTFDMRHATAVTGGPENALFAEASAAMGRFYGLPSASWVSTESLFNDSQAALEKAIGFQSHMEAGVGLVWGVGQLESEKTISLAQLVIDNEIIDFLRRKQRSFEVSPETLALDLAREVGIAGSFLESDHTREHFRSEFWEPAILNRQSRRADSIPLETAARKHAERLLNLEDSPALSECQTKELRRIEAVFKGRIPT